MNVNRWERECLQRQLTNLTALTPFKQLIKCIQIMNYISTNKFERMKTKKVRVHVEHNLGYFYDNFEQEYSKHFSLLN